MNQTNLRNIFWGLAAALFVVMLFMVPQYGISGDEVTQYDYGTSVWNYLKTFGADKTAVSGVYLENTQSLYGGFFDGFAAMLIDWFKPKDEFLLRHYWNMCFGFAGLVFGGLLAKELAGWRAGIIALIFLVCTPRFFGEIFNNPKDIPFATGYVAALLCTVRWFKQMDAPRWKTTILLGLSIALAISVRIGGILVIAYLGMFYLIELWRRKALGTPVMGKSLKHLVVALVIGWLGACIWWPYALEDIINHPFEALKVMSAYPLNITTLYKGVEIRTTDIPADYLPTWLSIGTPLFLLFGFIGALFFIPRWVKREHSTAPLLLLFAFLFPIAYIIYKKSVVYDGMRHIMFVLPLLTILAALFIEELLHIFSQRKPFQYGVIAVTLVLMALPIRHMLANHPNQYVYFNEFSGGLKNAYGNYETDYYFNSVKEAFVWLQENKLKQFKPTPEKDSILVASNAPAMVKQYVRISGLPVKFVYVRYYQRSESDWDYGIFMTRFLDKEQLVKGYFPGDKPAHVITADGVPLTVVQENDPQRRAFKGQEALKTGDNARALTLLREAATQYPSDVEIWRNLAIAAYQAGDNAEAENAIGKAYDLSTTDIGTANTAGSIYMQTGNFNKALQVFGKMAEDNPEAAEAWLGLGQAQAALKNYPLAIDNINKALALDARYAAQGYMALAYIYQQQGDMATAQKYAAAAQQAGGR